MKPNSAKNVTVTAPLAALNRRSRNSADVEHRVGGRAAPPTTNTSRSSGAEREAADRVRRGPAVRGRLDDRVDQRAEHRDRQDEPGQVERGHRRGRATRAPARSAARGRHQGERDQRPEHAPPGEVLEQQPADDRAGGHADADDGAPDAERGRPLAPLGEGVADDRQRRREDQRRRTCPSRTRAAISAPARVDERADDAGGRRSRPGRGSAPAGGRSGRTGCPPPARARRRRGCSRRRSTAADRVPASSSSEMLGSATLTIVVSRLMASTAAQTVSRTASLRTSWCLRVGAHVDSDNITVHEM